MTEARTATDAERRGMIAQSVAQPQSSGATPILEVRDLIKDYPGQRALDGMDFVLYPREVHALLGENGAGKSTMIKVISGVIRPTAGQILLDGKPIEPRSPQHAKALGISAVHQQANLVPSISVAENLMLGYDFPKVAGVFVDRRKLRARVQAVLDEIELDVPPSRFVSDLSPHEAGMVAIGKALMADARVIILDEPTAALFQGEVDVLFRQMRKLAARGIAFIYVSHRLGEVFQIAERITVMRDGRRVGTWRAADLTHRRLVDEIAGKERELIERRGTEKAVRGEPLLVVENLRAPNVNGVSFVLHAGEVLGLAGLSGSGAEETINTLYGNLPRQGGALQLAGKRVDPRHPTTAKELGFAFVPKDRHAHALLPGFAIWENVTLASTERYRTDRIVRWMKKGAERKEARRIVDLLSIKTRGVNQDISTLSGGNQQKVVIGRWLTRNAQVYLLDDPSAGVDVHSKSDIYEEIRTVATSGAGVIFTSTELEEMTRVCDRVLVFHEGTISGELVGDQITEANIVRLSFGQQSAQLRKESEE